MLILFNSVIISMVIYLVATITTYVVASLINIHKGNIRIGIASLLSTLSIVFCIFALKMITYGSTESPWLQLGSFTWALTVLITMLNKSKTSTGE